MSLTIKSTGTIWARRTGDTEKKILVDIADRDLEELFFEAFKVDILDHVESIPGDGLWVWEGRVAGIYRPKSQDMVVPGRYVDVQEDLDVICAGKWRAPRTDEDSRDKHGRTELERIAYEEEG